MGTCYKAFRTSLLQSIPIRSSGFGIEPELTIKLARRQVRIYETPISYYGRTYEEGKKIGFRDARRAIWVILRYAFTKDIYKDEGAGNAARALGRAAIQPLDGGHHPAVCRRAGARDRRGHRQSDAGPASPAEALRRHRHRLGAPRPAGRRASSTGRICSSATAIWRGRRISRSSPAAWIR